MQVLFLHNNFPAQYRHVAAALAADPQNRIYAASLDNKKNLPGVTKYLYKASREPAKTVHHYLRGTEAAVLDGQAVFRTCLALRKKGIIPDVVCGHSGWGTTIYVKDAFPEARLLTYFEWYYRAHDSDVDFFDKSVSYDDQCRIRTRNLPILMDLAHCDWGVSPTKYQLSQIPTIFHPKLSLLHDGVDTDFFKPIEAPKLVLPNLILTGDMEILTYATRGMEPYRGFPEFMRAAAMLQKRRPNLHVVIAGQDRVAYGKKLPEGETYRGKMLQELSELDQSRLHFTGLLPYDQYVQLLQVSTVHAYLTIPFVLSWSLLESMASGCLVVASDTAPVRELVEEGRTGLLFDFRSPQQLADRAEEAIERRAEMAEIRERARALIVERYALKDLLPKHVGLIRDLAEGRLPRENAVGLVEPAEKSAFEGVYAAPERRDATSAPRPQHAAGTPGQAPRSGRPGNLPRRKRRRRH